MRKIFFLFFIVLAGLSQVRAADSNPLFIQGTDTLLVYRSIPNLPEFMPRVEAAETQDIRTTSDKFTIRVRSAATNNEWIDVLALYVYNRALEIPDINQTNGTNSSTSVQHYPNATAAWSQTYGNIEMSYNQPVEVEIAAKNGFKIAGKDFFKATVHPSHKASAATVTNGKVYFTISNPAQVAIDINGQMDDYNAFVNPIGAPTHTITLFANPVIKKPLLNRTRTFYVENGKMPTVSPSTYDTLYFKPGVHDIGMNNKIYPGKAVYIPGDAIVYASISNYGVSFAGFSKAGEIIKIFGYGTISGARTKHPYYVLNSDANNHRPIAIDNALNYQIIGVTVADPANFSVWTPSGSGGFLSYVKVIGWRANGDGLGNGDNVNDCFVRTNDDCSYVRGNRKRVTYWKDNISAIWYMSAVWTSPILIEDCDVLYCRSRGGGGAAWDMRADNAVGVNQTQTTFRNIRFHDKLCNMILFNLISFKGDVANPTNKGGSYNWMKFENISIASCSVKQNMLGWASSPWNGGITFENVTFAGTKLTSQNFTTYFNINQYVTNTVFKSTDYYTITNKTNPYEGFITMSPAAPNYLVNSAVSLFAKARPGYKFTGWSGAVTSAANPITLTMNENKTITANYSLIETGVSSPKTAVKKNVTLYPNPATDKLFVNTASNAVYKIRLFDLTGKVVYTSNNASENETIGLTGITRGLYFIQVQTADGIFTDKVIIK